MLELCRITTIFFDLDHTLWDFEKNSELTFAQIFDEENISLRLTDFISAYNPINHDCWRLYRNNQITHDELRDLRLVRTFEELDYDYSPKLLAAVNKKYIDYLSQFTHLFKDTFSLLDYLAGRYELHIITNGFDAVQRLKIERSKLSLYFHHIITAEKAGHKKPSPHIFKYALDVASKTASESLMVGDSLEADIQGALAVGMQAIHFNSHDEALHDECPIVDSLQALQQLL